MFTEAPKYPFWGLPGPYIIVSLAAKSGSTEAPRKGRTANESKAIKGKRQLGWGQGAQGLASVLLPRELLASPCPTKG